MLFPSKTKYRKAHRNRGSFKGKAFRGSTITFGTYALKALDRGEINSRQIEAARRAISHSIKRGGKVWIRIFPQKAITRKAAEVPMGAGKGSVEFYVAQIKPGRILFEMDGVTEEIAKKALTIAKHKLPLKCKIVVAEQIN